MRPNFKDRSFQLKLVVFVLNMVNMCLWRLPTEGETGMRGPHEECLFAFALPAYTVLVFAMVMVKLLGETQNVWTHRLILFPGVVLFASTAVVAILNYCTDRTLTVCPLLLGIICMLTAVMLLADLFVNEHMFKRTDK